MSSHHLPPDLGGFNLWDWAGAVIGTAVSLVYSRPAARREFFARVFVSLLIGGVFGFLVGQTFGWPETAKHAVAGGFAMALFSYAVIEAGFRVIRSFEVKKADKPK